MFRYENVKYRTIICNTLNSSLHIFFLTVKMMFMTRTRKKGTHIFNQTPTVPKDFKLINGASQIRYSAPNLRNLG